MSSLNHIKKHLLRKSILWGQYIFCYQAAMKQIGKLTMLLHCFLNKKRKTYHDLSQELLPRLSLKVCKAHSYFFDCPSEYSTNNVIYVLFPTSPFTNSGIVKSGEMQTLLQCRQHVWLITIKIIITTAGIQDAVISKAILPSTFLFLFWPHHFFFN